MPPITIQQVAPTQRMPRYPTHTHHVRHKPWCITPFMIAPVLPMETLKRGVLQSRVVTDPIVNPLIGWWIEYYYFYVKHRDLDDRDDFTAMMLDHDYDLSTNPGHDAAVEKHYHQAAAVDWVGKCLKRVVEEYFRNEGETWNTNMIDGLPVASIGQQTWLDSVANDNATTDPDIDLTDVGSPGGAAVTASEIEDAMRTYNFMRHQGLINMSYEDFLATYGVRTEKVELHKPELLRYVRDWTYPTNTVDATDGSPSSACSWSVRETMDKDRLFKEPGFILGVTVARPKVYLSGQTASAIRLLDNAFSWLPALLRDDPMTSLKEVAASGPPLDNNTLAYWVDVRDLFMYGDQFINFATTETDAGLVALPTAGLEKRYATETDADALFAATQPSTLDYVRQDGVTTLNILGTQEDHTPTVNRS